MRTQLIAAFAAAFTATLGGAAFASDVGVVETVAATAYGTAPSAIKVEKHAGDPVSHRELLETSKQGGMMVKLDDGSELSLGAQTKLLVVAYAFQPKADVGAAVVSLPSGSLHYVTGAMPKGHTIIYTPTATMTLNGTDVTIGVNAQGYTHLAVAEGKVTVRSRITGQETVYNAGESVDITPQTASGGTAMMGTDPSFAL